MLACPSPEPLSNVKVAGCDRRVSRVDVQVTLFLEHTFCLVTIGKLLQSIEVLLENPLLSCPDAECGRRFTESLLVNWILTSVWLCLFCKGDDSRQILKTHVAKEQRIRANQRRSNVHCQGVRRTLSLHEPEYKRFLSHRLLRQSQTKIQHNKRRN